MKPLNEFNTLADAQSYSYQNERMISPDMVTSLLTQYNSVISLQNHAQTDDEAAGFLLALTGSVTEFNVMNSHPVGQAQQRLLDNLVAQGAVSFEFQQAMLAYANVTVYPYENTTQEEFDEAQPVAPSVQTIQWYSGQDICLTLLDPLDKTASVTTWLCNDGFKEENMGRSTHIDEPLKYRIDMSGKRGSGNVEVRVNESNVNFTVETI